MVTRDDDKIREEVKKKSDAMKQIINVVGLPTTFGHLKKCIVCPETLEAKQVEKARNALEKKMKELISSAKNVSEDEIAIDEGEYWNYFTEDNWEKLKGIVSTFAIWFDMNLYILHMGRLLNYDHEKLKRTIEWQQDLVEPFVHLMDGKPQGDLKDLRARKKRALNKAKELLKGVDIIDTSKVPDPIDQKLPTDPECSQTYNVTSYEFVGVQTTHRDREKKAQRRLIDIDEQIGLKNVVKYLFPQDLKRLCFYENLAKELSENLLKQITNEVQPTDEDDKKLENIIRQNIQFIDIDKMLTLSAERFLDSVISTDDGELKTGDLSSQQVNSCVESIKILQSLIKNRTTTVPSIRSEQQNGSDSSLSSRHEVTIIDIRTKIDELYGRCVCGIYYSKDDYIKLRSDIINGVVGLGEITASEFNNFRFTPGEIISLQTNNTNALSFLIANNLITSDVFETQVSSQERFSNEQILSFVLADLISREYFFQLYMQGKITLENILYIKSNADEKILKKLGFVCQDEKGTMIDGLVSQNKFVDLYIDPERNDEFEKYRRLYKLLVMEDTPEEIRQKRESGNDANALKRIEEEKEKRKSMAGVALLETLLDKTSIQRDDIFDLYNKGLITIENVITYGMIDRTEDDTQTFENLYISGELKPCDAKRLYKQGVLTEEFLKRVYTNSNIDITKRMMLLTSTFSDITNPEEVKMRNKFFRTMPNFAGENRREKTSIIDLADVIGGNSPETGDSLKPGITTEKTSEGSSKKNEVTDPFIRLALLEKLDPEYTFRFLDDGTLEAELPNLGVYVLEPLFDKQKKPKKGAATYIVTSEIYEKYKNQILEEKQNRRTKKKEITVRRKVLSEFRDKKVKGVTKIIHTGWGNAIMKYFGIEESVRYTEEQKKVIKELALMVEKSKKPITEYQDR